MNKIIFDDVSGINGRKFYSVKIPRWMRRIYGRNVRKNRVPRHKNPMRLFITEPDEGLNYKEALQSFRAGLLFDWNED